MLNVIKPGFLGALLGFSLGVGVALAAVDIEIVDENEGAAVPHTDVLKEFKKRRDARAEKLAQKGADMVDRKSGKPNLDRSGEYFTPVRTGYCECSCNAKADDPLQKEMNDVLESGASNDGEAADDKALESSEDQQTEQGDTEKKVDQQSDGASGDGETTNQVNRPTESDRSNNEGEDDSATKNNSLEREGDNTSTTESNRLDSQKSNETELENKPADDSSSEADDSSSESERVDNKQDQNRVDTEGVNGNAISNLQGNNLIDNDKLQKASDSNNNVSDAAAWPLNRIKLN